MSSDKRSGFDLDAVIEAERAGVEPPAEAADSGWAALQADLETAVVEPATDVAPSDLGGLLTPGITPAVWTVWGVVVVLVVALGAASWVMLQAPEPTEVLAEPVLAPATPKPGLSDEVELLGQAQAALEAQKTSEAERFLRTFRQRHPQPILEEELAALETRLACHSQQAGASAGAEEFVRLHPRSPYADRVKSDCGLRD